MDTIAKELVDVSLHISKKVLLKFYLLLSNLAVCKATKIRLAMAPALVAYIHATIVWYNIAISVWELVFYLSLRYAKT